MAALQSLLVAIATLLGWAMASMILFGIIIGVVVFWEWIEEYRWRKNRWL